MSTGLVASTVTPGNTAPEESLTTPAIAACAYTVVETSRDTINTAAIFTALIRTSIRKLSGKPRGTLILFCERCGLRIVCDVSCVMCGHYRLIGMVVKDFDAAE